MKPTAKPLHLRRSFVMIAVLGLGGSALGCASGGSEPDASGESGNDLPDASAIGDAGTTDTSCRGTPWGTVSEGFTGTAYASSMPAGPCESETRLCTDGVMSGSYVATTCTPGCTDTPWGDVPSGFSGTAYAAPHPATGTAPCSEMAQTRVCTSGSMSGSHTELSCTNYACALGDAMAQYQVWYVDDPDPAVSQWRRCELDGEWGPPTAGSPFPASPLCEWEGVWLPRYACGYFQGEVYICAAPDWELVTSFTGCPQGP
jgi:hypothetical protein